MKIINFGTLLLSVLFVSLSCVGEESLSDSCDQRALASYGAYRSALLSSQFDPQEVLSMLSDDYEKNISKEMYYRYFMALRLGEAKVSKILSYSASCRGEKIYLKLKTENYNEEYSRRSLVIRLDGERFFILDSSDDMPGTGLDKGVEYKPLPKAFIEHNS